jgi:hypothetical protein
MAQHHGFTWFSVFLACLRDESCGFRPGEGSGTLLRTLAHKKAMRNPYDVWSFTVYNVGFQISSMSVQSLGIVVEKSSTKITSKTKKPANLICFVAMIN